MFFQVGQLMRNNIKSLEAFYRLEKSELLDKAKKIYEISYIVLLSAEKKRDSMTSVGGRETVDIIVR
jgi:hypothetical protein